VADAEKYIRLESNLEKRLGRRPNPVIMERLTNEGYIDEYLSGRIDFNEVLKYYQVENDYVKDAYRSSLDIQPATQLPRRANLARYLQLRNRLIAQLVAQDSSVQSFRRKYLPAGLLAPQEVLAWIDARIPADISPFSGCVLSFHTPDYPLRVRVSKDSILGELSRISKELAERWGWFEADIVTFVLTAQLPRPALIKSSVTVALWQGIACAVRITIDADVEVPPEEVKRVYSSLRHKIWRGQRSRPLSRHLIELVEFVLDHDTSWQERWKMWNREHPEHPYASTSSMAVVFHRAKRKLLYPSYDPLVILQL